MTALLAASSNGGLSPVAVWVVGTVTGGLILAQLTWFGKTVVELAKHTATLKEQVKPIPQIQEDVRVISAQVAHVEGQLSGMGHR